MSLALRAVLLVLVALLPAGLVQLHLEREAREARREQVEAEALRLAGLVAAEQARIFEGARHLLSAMAVEDTVRAAVPGAACNDYMRRVTAAFPRYVSVQSVDLEGRTLCAPRPELFQPDLSHRAWFREAVAADRFAIGDVVTGASTGIAAIHASQPFRDAAGAPAGLLVIGLSLDWLNRELARLPIPSDATLLVADRAGVVVARAPDPAPFVGRPLSELRREMLEATQPGVREIVAVDGVRRIVGYVPVVADPPGLYIGVALDARAGQTMAAATWRRSALLILLSLAAGTLLLLVVFRHIVARPVDALLAAAARWRDGEWAARAERPHRGGEFARLVDAFNSMATEVAARERAQAQSDLRLRGFLELAPQMLFVSDTAGRVTWVNAVWSEATGLPRDAALGEGWEAALHPEDAPVTRAAWNAALKTGTPLESAFRLQDGTGGWRRYLSRAAPVREGGKIAAWTGVVADVTAIERAEAEAAETAARLAATYANAPVGLGLFDRDLRFLAVNEAMAEMNGRPAAEHLGRTLGEAAPHVAATVEPHLRAVFDTGQPVVDVEVSSGRNFRLCTYHPVRGTAGEVAGVSASVVDITARKRAEETERLLMREVDHRAKNALAVVRSLVRLSVAESRGDAGALVEALEGRIAAMTRAHTLLARSRWSGADLRELLREELAPYESAAFVEGPDATLAAEAAQPLAMVLHELATNALKHGALSRPEGRVRVAWHATEGGGLALEWAESGGPALDGPPADSSFGTRLIDANAMGLLDGAAERFWEPGGLRVVLSIGPGALVDEVIAAAPRPLRPSTPPRDLAGARVLLVEDEVLVALEASRLLTGFGCHVIGPAYSLEEALSLASRGDFDVAVLDVNLRGLGSGPVLDELRRRGVPVVVVSGYGAAPEGHEDVPVLDKPVSALRLREALSGALGAVGAVAAQ